MYSTRITRHRPTAIIILMDQSGSMSEKIEFNGTTTTKAHALSFIVDKMLLELLLRCKCEGGYRDYFDIAVQSYGGHGVGSAFAAASNKDFVSASFLADNYIDTQDITCERLLPSGRSMVSTVEHKRWIEPKAQGSTPMLEALVKTYDMLEKWVKNHSSGKHFAPMVFNITDAEASDAHEQQLLEISSKIRSLDAGDGNVLFFNIHLSRLVGSEAILFPSSKDMLPLHKYAQQLYDMSSELPDIYNDYLEDMGVCGTAPFRGVSFNTDMNKLLAILNIGSASINLI